MKLLLIIMAFLAGCASIEQQIAEKVPKAESIQCGVGYASVADGMVGTAYDCTLLIEGKVFHKTFFLSDKLYIHKPNAEA